MTVDGRALPVSYGGPKQPALTGRFTVTDTYQVPPPKTGSGSGSGSGVGKPTAPWMIELLDADTSEVKFIVSLAHDPKAPGDHAATGGWIALRVADAKRLYTRLDKGSVVLVTGSTPTVGATTSPSP